jgi:predicted metal-dependent hydrolase
MTTTAEPLTPSANTSALKQAFKARVRAWAQKLEVPVVWLAVRPMRHKWASCSSNGHLHFSSDLLDLDPDLWDYVIVHELLHLCIPNHGRLWKALMRAHLGDWERAEQRLRQHGCQPKDAPPLLHQACNGEL